MRLGPGQVVLDDQGRPVAFRHGRLPGLGFLLGESDSRHTADRAEARARGCCAFLYPSCVDGVPAHGPDPLDNDQDWALVYALRSGLVP
jgi:hypothetical protein